MSEISITNDEVFKVVQKHLKTDQFTIEEFSIKMLGEWVGMCGDHAVLTVKLANSTELSYFIKLFPRIESIVEFIDGTGAFRKEIFLYKIFDLYEKEGIKILHECVAKCYLSINKRFLIMENLAQRGFSSPDKQQLLEYDSVKVVLDALAKFHASTIIYEEKTRTKLIDEFFDDFGECYYNEREDFPNRQGLKASLNGVVNSIELLEFPQTLLSGKDFRAVLYEVLEEVFQLVKPSKQFRNVITHGDIWATNLLLRKDENGKAIECKLVDFQCGRYTPPAQDVMAVIYLTTSREFRKESMYSLIGIYYTSLEKHITLAGYNMKEILRFDEFLKSCEEQKVFGMIQAAVYFPLVLLESEDAQEFFTDAEKNKEALLEDRSILIKQHMGKNENYLKRIRDSIQDLKDYCDYL